MNTCLAGRGFVAAMAVAMALAAPAAAEVCNVKVVTDASPDVP